ncbi:pyridoxal phosphate-dependent transferase [Durotheca rogersii]|uniref:pyridoxal phosphate-dependent transferase n=1 Tax=Durotheca rogersii TaxID=419775 RepID=UPI00221F8FDC|nr:pyridoxal phosphate-dependent transferase [Durotheca rogersii]KAI5866937.1 pyridoxal phosphate-dependent transferase [Durotheca rogersii]
MDSKQFRDAAVSAVDEIVKYYDTIEERRVASTVEPGYLRKLLPEEAPQDGESWADIQKDLEAKILPGITHWQSPNFLAWFPSSSSFPAMLGEMYSAALTGAAFNWICSPAVTELETIVLDWLARALALPPCFLSTGPTGGGGVIHGTASEAVATVLVAARDRYLRDATAHLTDPDAREDAIALRRTRLVALASAAAHTATRKAAQIAGVRFRTVPVYPEDGYRMTGAAVRDVVLALRARGLEPFYLTATLGTTDTCAIDDMDGIAEVLEELGPSPEFPVGGSGGEVWVHIDAAYAGSALVCPEHRLPDDSRVLSRFDSFNVNLHKWLLVNFDCSALFVRDRRPLIAALSTSPLAILSNAPTDSGLVTDYRDWQIPFGRRFRALKVWFVLRSYGVAGLRAHIRRHVTLAETFAAQAHERADLFEIVTGPRFALTLVRVARSAVLPPPSGAPDGEEEGEAEAEEEAEVEARRNVLTKRVYDAILADGRIFLSSTVLSDGVFAIRHNPATPFVQARHVDKHFEVFVEIAEKVLAEAKAEAK